MELMEGHMIQRGHMGKVGTNGLNQLNCPRGQMGQICRMDQRIWRCHRGYMGLIMPMGQIGPVVAHVKCQNSDSIFPRYN